MVQIVDNTQGEGTIIASNQAVNDPIVDNVAVSGCRTISLAYQADPLPLFARIRCMPLPALLHSNAPAHPQSRYDIIAADPAQHISYAAGALNVNGRAEPTRDPLSALVSHVGARPQGIEADTPPFTQGFIGSFGYPLHTTIEPTTSTPRCPTGLPALFGGIYRWSIVTDHYRRTTLLHLSPAIDTAYAQALLARLTGKPAPGGGRVETSGRLVETTSRADYFAAFERAQHYIHAGDCYQVNLARHFAQRFRGASTDAAWALYRQLARSHPEPFAAFLGSPWGHIVSLSPERFLRRARIAGSDQLETCPIKGTARRGADPVADAAARTALAHSSKDRAENLMIVDLLRNDLGRVCRTGSITVPQLYEPVTLAHVHHLVSTVRGQPRAGVGPAELLHATFPGGSITGAPKIRAMEIINELEPVGRSHYCGAIGYIDVSGRLDLNVAIRTLLVTREHIHCWGGGGIVADSTAQAEWREIDAKVGALLQSAASLSSA